MGFTKTTETMQFPSAAWFNVSQCREWYHCKEREDTTGLWYMNKSFMLFTSAKLFWLHPFVHCEQVAAIHSEIDLQVMLTLTSFTGEMYRIVDLRIRGYPRGPYLICVTSYKPSWTPAFHVAAGTIPGPLPASKACSQNALERLHRRSCAAHPRGPPWQMPLPVSQMGKKPLQHIAICIFIDESISSWTERLSKGDDPGPEPAITTQLLTRRDLHPIPRSSESGRFLAVLCLSSDTGVWGMKCVNSKV